MLPNISFLLLAPNPTIFRIVSSNFFCQDRKLEWKQKENVFLNKKKSPIEKHICSDFVKAPAQCVKNSLSLTFSGWHTSLSLALALSLSSLVLLHFTTAAAAAIMTKCLKKSIKEAAVIKIKPRIFTTSQIDSLSIHHFVLFRVRRCCRR